MPVAVLFTAPFLLSPLFYLTTGKAGWILLLPVAIAGNASDRTSFKTFLIVAAIGVVVFTVGWLLQEAGRPR